VRRHTAIFRPIGQRLRAAAVGFDRLDSLNRLADHLISASIEGAAQVHLIADIERAARLRDRIRFGRNVKDEKI